MKKKLLLVALLAIIVIACTTNPLTGRKSLSLVSNAQIFPQAFAAYDETLSQSKVLPSNNEQSQMISKVGNRLKLAAEEFYKNQGRANELQGFEWEFSLIESDQVNAWAMPGGKIAFYTGILPICQDETGVAVVMAHEVVHALAGHSKEQMSNSLLAQYGGAIGGVALSNSQWSNIFNQYYGTAAGVTLLRYGRKMESDADAGGLKLMAYAGYDPREAAPFWERMNTQSEGKKRPPEFLSSHPHPQTRIDDINKLLPEAIQIYNNSPNKGK